MRRKSTLTLRTEAIYKPFSKTIIQFMSWKVNFKETIYELYLVWKGDGT